MSSCYPRRTVLKGAALGAIALPAIAACSDGSGILGRTPEPGEVLAAIKDLPDGQPVALTTAKGVPVILAREGDEVMAYSAVCPHGGCAVRVEVANLLCPCHNSRFEFDGTFISGPANSDLPTTPIVLEDGNVVTA
ncbi:MAG: Rieske (2Fe-2S) protein [bacterium]|nr:Rieske (2Fe-2S) protein [bacterium]